MSFALPTTTAPMEAKLVADLPADAGWQYEPKWDGFRALVFKEGDDIALMSKSGKPLGRFFPEVVAMVAVMGADRFVVDGELIVEVDGSLAFDALQARLHPAASRIARLAHETPAQLMLFDALADPARCLDAPLVERRARLAAIVAVGVPDGVRLSPYTLDPTAAAAWLVATGGALDGVVAKRRDGPYVAGERAMAKVKPHRTVDCVVGGYRTGDGGVASLLLGLYDADGALHHVGHTSAIKDVDRAALTTRLAALAGPSPFTGASPGKSSRWNNGVAAQWHPLRPELVVEVRYDQVTAGRFRHGTGLVRWRPDKAPAQCTVVQLAPALRPAELAGIVAA